MPDSVIGSGPVGSFSPTGGFAPSVVALFSSPLAYYARDNTGRWVEPMPPLKFDAERRLMTRALAEGAANAQRRGIGWAGDADGQHGLASLMRQLSASSVGGVAKSPPVSDEAIAAVSRLTSQVTRSSGSCCLFVFLRARPLFAVSRAEAHMPFPLGSVASCGHYGG